MPTIRSVIVTSNSSKYDPIVLLVAGTSLLMASGSVVFTLLPSMQDEVGFPTWGFGLIAGIFFAASLVAQLALARFADQGKARVLLVTAILLGVASLIWMAFAGSLLEISIARGIGGLATGCWGPAARATAIAGRPDQTARRLGYIAMGDTSGLVVGPLLGSVLATTFSIEVPFLVFAALIACMTPVLFSSPIAEVRTRTESPKITTLVRRRTVLQATVLAVALFLPVGLYETVWGKHISNLGGSTHIIALSVALYGLPYMVIAPLGGRLGDRVGPARVALFGAAGVVAITLLTGLPRNLWILLPIGVIEAMISAVAYPNALAAVSNACTPQEQATGQGLAGAASIGGAGLMALLAGPLFEFGGPVVAFATAAGLVALGAAVAYGLGPSAFSATPPVAPDGEPGADYRSSVNVSVADLPPSPSR